MSKWRVDRNGPNWLMDDEGRLVGYKDNRSVVWTVGQESQPTNVLESLLLPGSGASSAESFGVDYNATPALNVARINLALQMNRAVTLSKPGQYLFGGPGQGGILIPGNSVLIFGDDVEPILADGTVLPLIRNANSWATPITVPGTMVFSTINSGSGMIATANAPGIGIGKPAGSWVAVGGLDPSIANNRAYQGVFRVYASSPDSIQFHIVDWPVGGTASSAGATIYPADANMRVIGGVWDGNDVGQNSAGIPAGDPREHTMHFRNCQNVIVRGQRFRRGMSWSIGVNNIRDATFEDFGGDIYLDALGAADVLFQGSGGGRNVLVRKVAGMAKDNLVAWSLDAVGTATYLNHDPGSVYGLKFEDIEIQGNSACGMALWGNTNHRFHSVEIDGVRGRTLTEGMVKVDNGYAPTAMLNTRGNKLTIKNIEGNCAGSVVSIRSDGDWDHIDVNGVRNMRTTSHSAASLVSVSARSGGTTQVINRLDLSNLHHSIHGATLNRTGPAVIITDTTIGQLKVEKMPSCRLAAGTSLIAHTGTLGTINRMVVEDVHAVANGSGDCFLVSCENTNAAAIGQLTVRDSTFTAFDATGGLVRQTPTGKVLKVRRDNSDVLGGTGEVGGAAVSNIVRDGTGMAIEVVSSTNTAAN